MESCSEVAEVVNPVMTDRKIGKYSLFRKTMGQVACNDVAPSSWMILEFFYQEMLGFELGPSPLTLFLLND